MPLFFIWLPSNPAAGIRVPLSEHRQRQALSQPRPDGHQAGHGPDRVHVLRAVPRHDQVSDYLRQRHPQRLVGMFQEDCRKSAASGNHVEFHLFRKTQDIFRTQSALKTLFKCSHLYLNIL